MQLLMNPQRCDTRVATFPLIGTQSTFGAGRSRLRASQSYRALMRIAEKRVLDPL